MKFTRTVNRFLRGNYADVEPTNRIEKEAKEFHKKKKNIGKYMPKVGVCDNSNSNKSVIGKREMITPEAKKDVKMMSARNLNGAKSSDNKENKTMISALHKIEIKKGVKGKLVVKTEDTESCDKKLKVKNSVIKKAAKSKPTINKTAMVALKAETENKNFSVHKMQLRNKRTI